MPSLAPPLRRRLESAVREARDVAEVGAAAALEQLAVHAAEPFGHLSPGDRELRNRLRARARQLGDARDARTGAHQIDRLVVECAYEHWHRMLFARFLAENGVLMANSEDLGIENTPVTLEECEELAPEEGAGNGWELAGRYASKMLPQIFRPGAPVLAVHLPPERQRRLEQILANLVPETFKASDALGWVYQFWQAKKKDEVNASGGKIGADELPAVTQLFTEPYMVEFLLHNTLGAWWAGKVLAERPELARTAQDEDDLRQACALPGCCWEYLRFVRTDGVWRPAAGKFEGWPKAAAGLRVLDPCCGSGHFLVTAFELLSTLRAAEEQLSTRDAGDAVLQDNLFGLEIDERCTQIAAFAVALRAWTIADAGHRPLPRLRIACSGLAPQASRSTWIEIAGDEARLANGMVRFHELAAGAPLLGSLVDPKRIGMSGSQRQLDTAGLEELRPLIDSLLASDEAGGFDGEALAVQAQGAHDSLSLLGREFTLVVTNVPYLHRGKQAGALRDFCSRNYPESKADLATTMLDRICDGLLAKGGVVAAVAPQPWLFLDSYKAIRRRLLKSYHWPLSVRLGTGAFSTITGEVVDVVLVCLADAPSRTGVFADLAESAGPEARARELPEAPLPVFAQQEQLANPDSRVIFGELVRGDLLAEVADSIHGQGSFDDPSYVRRFWELPRIAQGWIRQQTSGTSDAHDSGLTNVFLWEEGQGRLARLMASKARAGYTTGKWRAGRQAWGRRGVAVSGMGRLYVNRYSGQSFDTNVAVIYPSDDGDFDALYCFCRSEEFVRLVRQIDRKPKVTPKTFSKVPFDRAEWVQASKVTFPDGVPPPRTDDPRQWIFGGEIAGSESPLQVAIARVLGYRWPEQVDDGLGDHVDDDGIVCLPSVRGEEPAADRLLAVLAAAYGSSWSTKQRDAVLADVGGKGKGLGWWLRHKFFLQHCQVFQHRPFIWHIWDGIKKDGFGALVNYHKLDHKLLETLTYTYLGDWIRRQQDDTARNVDGSSERLDAARRLQQSLERILQGEDPDDIFVRWKPLHEQPIGWEPDLNDGVRVNIRPFLTVPDVDRKGAGILRYKPNVHWKKDRGTDPDDAPWYDLGPTYEESEGARINDHHLSLGEKRAAREAREGLS